MPSLIDKQVALSEIEICNLASMEVNTGKAEIYIKLVSQAGMFIANITLDKSKDATFLTNLHNAMSGKISRIAQLVKMKFSRIQPYSYIHYKSEPSKAGTPTNAQEALELVGGTHDFRAVNSDDCLCITNAIDFLTAIQSTNDNSDRYPNGFVENFLSVPLSTISDGIDEDRISSPVSVAKNSFLFYIEPSTGTVRYATAQDIKPDHSDKYKLQFNVYSNREAWQQIPIEHFTHTLQDARKFPTA